MVVHAGKLDSGDGEGWGGEGSYGVECACTNLYDAEHK